MNRDRFKFRVWDGEKYFNDNVFLLPTGELGFFVNSMGNPSHRAFQHQENFTIEQCTGLTDKNGRLIFEGDVVRINNDCTGKVGFNDPPIYGFEKDEMKIIGNIHEDQFREVTKKVEE